MPDWNSPRRKDRVCLLPSDGQNNCREIVAINGKGALQVELNIVSWLLNKTLYSLIYLFLLFIAFNKHLNIDILLF